MKRHKKGKKRIIFFVFVLLAAFLLSGGIVTIIVWRGLPAPDRLTERSINESTRIYDRTGKVLLYEIHGEEKRTIIPLEEIPPYVKYAAVAAEDHNFYNHIGVDFRGIARAFIKNLIQRDVRQGGSTITQQLVKNSLLTGERTIVRKFREALLAVAIEKKYSKDEILGFYLNQIPYGSNAYGIASAADTFFAKPVGDLTIGEAATLAALPKAPTYYSPYGSHTKELLERKDGIIDEMARGEYISKVEAKVAHKEKITFAPFRQNIRAPHFVMYVREYLIEKYGEDFVERGGLSVTTTLDWELQQMAENVIKEGADRNEKLVEAKNAALTAIDPRSGEILAMVGSRDYFDVGNDGNVNVTTRPRQPGSSFKPFVYATAFKKGFTPETVVFDVPTEFNANCNPDGTPGPSVHNPQNCYHPKNYDGKFRGPVTLRSALAQSLNLPSVKLLYLAGVKDSIDTARQMGITTLQDPDRYGLTLVLGGAEVTLLDMVSSYGVFAQDGILHPKTAILKVESPKGETLEEKKENSVPALDTTVARIMDEILSDNDARLPVFSPQSSLYFPNRIVAAKTGTTQDYRDAWVIGYTPSLVSGVWVGNNNNTPMKQSSVSVMVAGPIWHAFMERALAKYPSESFAAADKILSEKPVLRGLYRTGSIVKIDKVSRKLATSDTPPDLIEEIAIGEVKTILALIKKEDPLGAPPPDPTQDPQYTNWQAGIDGWLAVNKLPDISLPVDTDDLHTPDKKPHIQLLSPHNGAPADYPLTEIHSKVTSVFPLQEVSLFIDDEFITSLTGPFTSEDMTFSLTDKLLSGHYTIKISAYDSVSNKEIYEEQIEVR